MNEPSPKIECTLPEAPREERRALLRDGFFARVRETRELPDGFAFALPGDAEAAARDLAAFESDCCGFARWEVRREGADTVWLDVRGPEGTKDFIRRMLSEREVPAPDGAGGGGDAERTLRRGAFGLGAGIVALLACEVPILLGIAGAGAIGLGLEVVGGAALLAGLAAVGRGLWRRRRGSAAPT